MGRSEWVCNNCTEGFESRGKRDAHRSKKHREKVILNLSESRKQEIKRSEKGSFDCLCGKEFGRAHALRRHAAGCKVVMMSQETADVNDNVDEGISLF